MMNQNLCLKYYPPQENAEFKGDYILKADEDTCRTLLNLLCNIKDTGLVKLSINQEKAVDEDLNFIVEIFSGVEFHYLDIEDEIKVERKDKVIIFYLTKVTIDQYKQSLEMMIDGDNEFGLPLYELKKNKSKS